MVRNRDPMGIAAEIGQYRLRPAKRRLGIDHPFGLASANQALHRLRGQRLIWIDGYKQLSGLGQPVPAYRLNEPVITVLLNEQSGALGWELAQAYAEESGT